MDDLEKLMTETEAKTIGIAGMPREQRGALQAWALRLYSLGSASQHNQSDIKKIKYEGHLIVLEDGSKWEVDDMDADTASSWSELDKVVIIGGDMYRLDDLEKVSVTKDTDGVQASTTDHTKTDLLDDLLSLDASDGSLDGKIDGI